MRIKIMEYMNSGFGIVPIDFLKDKKFTDQEKLFIIYILAHTGGGIFYFSKLSKIAEDLNYEEKQIQELFESLEEKGIIDMSGSL